MTIKIAQTEAELRRCLPALLTLRPHLTEVTALPMLLHQQAHEHFHVAFVEEDNGHVPAVITYRFMTLLFSGKTCYIDDLSTLPEARGKGYAGTLLDFVIDQARQQGFQTVSLDSGPTRHDAHRLYLNKRFKLSSHHFALTLKREG
jgi:GNAT superfamily N-acetyltransferase